MDSEGLITWNLPNVITFILMLAIIWIVGGTLGHVFIRQPARKATNATNTTVAPNGVAVV